MGSTQEQKHGSARVGLSHRRQSALSMRGGMGIYTEEEVDAMIEAFAREDQLTSKTWSRRVVENFLSKFTWYFPRRDFPNAPSLSKAYAYYEHITLPRQYAEDLQADHIMRLAEPGESSVKTELYNPWTLPSSSLIEWGIGVDLYFSSLRLLAATLLFAGLLHLPNAIFYASTDYSSVGKGDLKLSLQGSAICTSREWVVCLNCPKNEFDDDKYLEIPNSEVALVSRNMCDGGQFPQGLVNWVVLFFLLVVVAFVALYIRAREVRFDEDKVSASDYSVIVKNPPVDALDPDEWRDFFSQFSDNQVTVVTIALNNEKLVRKLILRRVYRTYLRMKLEKGIDMDDEDLVRSAVARLVLERDSEPKGCLHRLFICTALPIFNLFGMFLRAETLVDRVFALTEEIKELQKEKYDATKVFVTFEAEEGQRSALTALTIGKLDWMAGNTSNLAPSATFRGIALKVDEPSEPSAIRWLDLSKPMTTRIIWRLVNFCITIGIVAACGWAVNKVRYSTDTERFAGYLITIFNTVIPQVVKILMIFEPHHTEGSFQTSLYLKITLFRWANTAVLTKALTWFTRTLDTGSSNPLPQINSILWAELYLTPILTLLDVTSNLQKHILGPRARTQEEMNLNFQGTRYNLGERYTQLTKVLFVCFFYSALYPTTFFFGAAILTIQYYTDKYCLTRIWSRSPFIGDELAKFSRRYFFFGAILAYALVSSYAWAQFPYDNVCDLENPEAGAAGEYTNLFFKNGTAAPPITVKEDQDLFVQFCSQHWRDFKGFSFPPTARVQTPGKEWMDESQENLVNLYGYTALIMTCIFVVTFFGSSIISFFVSWFRGQYKPSGQDQHIDYSANPDITAYVPQIRVGGFPFPFLACNIDHIDQSLIGWNDPTHSYDYHNMVFDVPWHGMRRTKIIEENTRDRPVIAAHEGFEENSSAAHLDPVILKAREDDDYVGLSTRPIFSVIKHYPPEWTKKLQEEGGD